MESSLNVVCVPAAVRPKQLHLPSERVGFVSGSIFFSFLERKGCADTQIELATHRLLPDNLMGTKYILSCTGQQDWAKSGLCQCSSKALLLVGELGSGIV